MPYDQTSYRKDQDNNNHPYLQRYIFDIITTDIDPHLIDLFAGIYIEILHDRTSPDRRFVRILGIELTSCLLLRSCYDVIWIRIITTEEITKRIFCCIFFSIFRLPCQKRKRSRFCLPGALLLDGDRRARLVRKAQDILLIVGAEVIAPLAMVGFVHGA